MLTDPQCLLFSFFTTRPPQEERNRNNNNKTSGVSHLDHLQANENCEVGALLEAVVIVHNVGAGERSSKPTTSSSLPAGFIVTVSLIDDDDNDRIVVEESFVSTAEKPEPLLQPGSSQEVDSVFFHY